MSLFITFIIGNSGNVLVLASFLILACFSLCESSVSLENRDTVFLVVTVLFNLVGPLFLILPGLLGGFGFLFGLAVLTLLLPLILTGPHHFLAGFFQVDCKNWYSSLVVIFPYNIVDLSEYFSGCGLWPWYYCLY